MAKKFIRQREAVQQQQEMLKGNSSDNLEAVKTQKKNATGRTHKRTFSGQTMARQPVPSQAKLRICKRCGKGSHPHQSCPAREATCYRCNRKGHYSSQCLSRMMGELTTPNPQPDDNPQEDNDLYSDTVYLNAVNKLLNDKQWRVTVLVENNSVSFKVDTGAEVTALSEVTFQSFANPVAKLQKSTQILRGPNRLTLEVMGEATMKLTYKEKSCNHRIFVIRNLQNNLLGLPAIKALEVISGINAIEQNIPDQYPALFSGLSTFKGEYTIKLKPEAKPFSLFTPRNVPLPLREKVRLELKRMEKLGVISPVKEPTQWCAGMVIVPKPSGSIRVRVDLKPLNESVMREVHPLTKVDITLAQLTGAKVFSTLDTNSGFWQVPLAKQSRLLTTFITPYGRYCFNKLPFGITIAPEHFQRRTREILKDLPGVVCHVDNVLISGKDQDEHDKHLHVILKKIQAAGITLNKVKCQFSRSSIKFLGHIIDADGVSPDPSKTEAIKKMKAPTTVTELRRFMGMINQLNKFSPNIAHLSQPLRELLKATSSWMWTQHHDEAFCKLKEEISSPRVLTHYDVNAPTKISADASAYGVGAVLLQCQDNSNWKPVAFASRSLNPTEIRYAQIEKEALSLVWSCEKFSDYILGKSIFLETDHKPLVPLLGSKSLDSLPPRVLRFCLQLMKFQYSISQVPGKMLYMADTLSRAPLPSSATDEITSDTESFVHSVISAIPASTDYLDSYRTAQKQDSICSKLMEFCNSGWPKRNTLKGNLNKYWQFRASLTINDDLLLFGSRIVIPESKQMETLEKIIHQGHQGFQKCRFRIVSAVWWPGVTKALENFIKTCPVCQQTVLPKREPLMTTQLPNHPWEKLATDLFELKGSTYILLVDYYSRFVEVQKLNSTTTASVIAFLKPMFARYGIPATLISDNGPQFISAEMKEFAETYGFHHITTSPYYPQANVQAERTVKTVKNLLSNAKDPHMALLSYRTTPLIWCGLSPAELLMGQKIKTDVPQPQNIYIPTWTHTQNLKDLHMKYKSMQEKYYNNQHRATSLPSLPDNSPVWVQTESSQVPGTVVQQAATPRSYIVSTPTGQVRRNRISLRHRRERGTTEIANESPNRSVTSSS